jgi:CPA2 family monovalent cation:H+ antiporter-2
VFRGDTLEETESPDRSHPRLHSVLIVQGAPCIGRTLGELGLASLGIEVTAIRHRGVRSLSPGADTKIEQGDVVVLFGPDDTIGAAEIRLFRVEITAIGKGVRMMRGALLAGRGELFEP